MSRIGRHPVAIPAGVIFVTTARTDEEARELLTQFNMPFTK